MTDAASLLQAQEQAADQFHAEALRLEAIITTAKAAVEALQDVRLPPKPRRAIQALQAALEGHA